jgi:hypothetical protein
MLKVYMTQKQIRNLSRESNLVLGCPVHPGPPLTQTFLINS